MLLCAFVFRRSACQRLQLTTHPSQGEGRAAREDEEKDKWGKKEEKTTGQTSKQPNTHRKKKAFFVFFNVKGVTTYLILAEEDQRCRGRKRQSGQSKKEPGIRREKTQREVQRAHTKGRRKEESMRGEERGGRGRQL